MGKRRDSRPRCARDAGIRHLRLEHLLREELNSLFDSEVNDQILTDVRVTRVELSLDGSRASAWVDVGTSEADESYAEKQSESATIETALRRVSAFLRRRLTDALPLKRSPELRFYPSVLAFDASDRRDEEA